MESDVIIKIEKSNNDRMFIVTYGDGSQSSYPCDKFSSLRPMSTVNSCDSLYYNNYIDSILAKTEYKRQYYKSARLKERIDDMAEAYWKLQDEMGTSYNSLSVLFGVKRIDNDDYISNFESFFSKYDDNQTGLINYINYRLPELISELEEERRKEHKEKYKDITDYGTYTEIKTKTAPRYREKKLQMRIRQLRNLYHTPEETAEEKKRRDRAYQTRKAMIQRGLSFNAEYFCTFTAVYGRFMHCPTDFLDFVEDFLKKSDIQYVIAVEPFSAEIRKGTKKYQSNAHTPGDYYVATDKVYDYYDGRRDKADVLKNLRWHIHAITDKPVDMDLFNALICQKCVMQYYDGDVNITAEECLKWFKVCDRDAVRRQYESHLYKKYNIDSYKWSDDFFNIFRTQLTNTYCEPIYAKDSDDLYGAAILPDAVMDYIPEDNTPETGQKKCLKYMSKFFRFTKQTLGNGVRIYRSNVTVRKVRHQRLLIDSEGDEILLYENKEARAAASSASVSHSCYPNSSPWVVGRFILDNCTVNKGVTRSHTGVNGAPMPLFKAIFIKINDKKSDTGLKGSPIPFKKRLCSNILTKTMRYIVYIEHIPDD